MWFKTKHAEERREMLDLLKSMQEVSKTQAQLMQLFIKSYEITGPPEVRVMTDEDEAKMELEALEAKTSFPTPAFHTLLSMD